MAKVWVLETHTKGTGANMVPLERDAATAAPAAEPGFRAPRPRRPAESEAAPKAPLRFRIVEVTTRRVLADDASTREAVDALAGVRSVVDVAVSVRRADEDGWRLLTHGEQRRLWDLREAVRPAAAGT